jgi:hypothetical protein
MFKKIQSRTEAAPIRWRAWLCLAVAITFLYNPFLATASSWGGQCVTHLPSFRATVASLEFVKSAPEENTELASAPDCDVEKLTEISPAEQESWILPRNTSECVPTPFFPTGNLFFRPPPAV